MKLADFGVAAKLTEKGSEYAEHYDAVAGSPYWMAPEVGRARACRNDHHLFHLDNPLQSAVSVRHNNIAVTAICDEQ